MKSSFALAGCIAAGLLTAGAAWAAAPVPAAPVIGHDKDTDGRPLPFGRQPRLAPDQPSGSGAFKAIMATDPALPAHVLYYPKDLTRTGKLPVVAFGNGACINAGNRFRYFLTEIASHGYLVAANGVMANPDLEVGPQENPAVRKPGDPAPAPRPAGPPPGGGNPRAPGTTTPEQLIETLDWAAKVNADPKSPFYHRLDTSKVAVMGQSCGGVQSLNVASDPRIKTEVIWSSGVGMIPNNPPDPAKVLTSVHFPIALIHGDPLQDIAYPAAVANGPAITQSAVFEGWQDGMTHLGTYGQKDGGYFGVIGVAWLDWQLKGDTKAATMFKGKACTLCTAPTWHIAKHGIDRAPRLGHQSHSGCVHPPTNKVAT